MAYLVEEDPNEPGTYLLIDPYNSDEPLVRGYGPMADRPTAISWNDPGSKFYEKGIDRAVIYVDELAGVPWIGLVSVDEAPKGGEERGYYLDGIRHVNRTSPEEFKGKLEAYTYPYVFESCDGTESIANGLGISYQRRKPFGLTYRTRIGNDIDGLDHGYKIHILYNVLALPSQKTNETLSDDGDIPTFSWDLTARPSRFEDPSFGVKYSSHLVLDSRVTYPWALKVVEDVLYGTDANPARLPDPQELLSLFVDNALIKVIDNEDGTYTIDGPDEIIVALGDDLYEIDWPSVVELNDEEVQISSL